jgi:hypothetical protein
MIAASIMSKKYVRPGGMAQSVWTRSIRAVRATPVADYSAPSRNATHHGAYRPPIAFQPFLLSRSVSYFQLMLWSCAQLLPQVGMDSFGMCLHLDCDSMVDAAKSSPRVPSSCAQNTILSLLLIQDCKGKGDAAKISPHIPSMCAQNATFFLLMMHIISSRPIYLAIDNPSLVRSICSLTTIS